MSDIEKQKVLRYAEIALKATRRNKQSKGRKEEDLVEMNEIRESLKMTHEEIMNLATRKIFPGG